MNRSATVKFESHVIAKTQTQAARLGIANVTRTGPFDEDEGMPHRENLCNNSMHGLRLQLQSIGITLAFGKPMR